MRGQKASILGGKMREVRSARILIEHGRARAKSWVFFWPNSRMRAEELVVIALVHD